MTNKFTPGPWKFSDWEQFGDTRFYISQQEGAPYTEHYSDVASLIAETVSSELVDIQRANATLIAAAPDLLDALQEITQCGAEAWGEDRPCVKWARSVILKALGQQ